MSTVPKSNKPNRGRSGRGRGRGLSKSTVSRAKKTLKETIELSSSDGESNDCSDILPKPVLKRARRYVVHPPISEEDNADVQPMDIADMDACNEEHQAIHMSKGKKRALSDDDKPVTDVEQETKLTFAEDDDISITSKSSEDVSKVEPSKVALNRNTVYHDAATSHPSPETDESDVGTRDSALKATYKGLVNIRVARMHSWSDRAGNGQPSYTGILKAIVKINKPLVMSAIIFQKHRNFANLSRVDPALISTGLNGQTFFHLCGSSGALVFTSVVLVDESHIMEGKSNPNSRPIKSISGTLIEGEWERLVGAIGMVIHEQDFKAQIFKDNLSFSTTPFNDESPVASPSKSSRLFSGQQSPFSRRATSVTTKIALNFNDTVPLYDARRLQNNFIETLDNLNSLPPYKHEIPPGSCVVIGYTIHTFMRKQDQMKSLSFNVQWAMLVGKL